MEVKRKIIIVAIVMLLIPLLHTPVCATSDIAALGNVKGIFIALKLTDKTPPGMANHRINKTGFLKHINSSFSLLSKEYGFKVYSYPVPDISHTLHINVTIEGGTQKDVYYITALATLKNNGAEWYTQADNTWSKQSYIWDLVEPRKAVKDAENDLNYYQLTLGDLSAYSSASTQHYYETRIAKSKEALDIMKGRLKFAKKKFSFLGTIKDAIATINTDFYSEHMLAGGYQAAHDKKVKETEALLRQLNAKASPAAIQRYVKSKGNTNKKILYEVGTIITLHNPSDTSIALYKDVSLTYMTCLFTNGISATITDYEVSSDKPTVYKVQILLKGGSEYTGWIPETVISTKEYK